MPQDHLDKIRRLSSFRFDGIYDARLDEEVARTEPAETLKAVVSITKLRLQIGLQKVTALSVIALAGLGFGVFLAVENMEAANAWWLAWGPVVGFALRSILDGRLKPP